MGIWYHYTTIKAFKKIKKEGLRGGNGLHGGFATEYTSTPTLYLASGAIPDSDLQRYGGYILKIELPEEFEKEGRILFGTLILKGEGILVPPEHIKDLYRDYKNGWCEWDKVFCPNFCSEWKECTYNPNKNNEENDKK